MTSPNGDRFVQQRNGSDASASHSATSHGSLFYECIKLPSPDLAAQQQSLVNYGAANLDAISSMIDRLVSYSANGAAQTLGLHRAVLFSGPPGAGKSTIARLAGNYWAFRRGRTAIELRANAHMQASGERGGSQHNVLKFARQISEIASSGNVVFVILDEVETMLTDRRAINSATNPMDTTYSVNAALELLDGLASNVVFFATTNFPQLLDSAARDRFDFHIAVTLPNDAARLKLLARAVHAINPNSPMIAELIPPAKTRTVQKLLRATEGYSIRQLNHLILRSSLLPNGDLFLDMEQLLRTASLMLLNSPDLTGDSVHD